jgi:hypothetical protein
MNNLLDWCRLALRRATLVLALASASGPVLALGWGLDYIRAEVGEYALRLSPADLDLLPRRSGSGVGLRVTGRVMDVELSKKRLDDLGWTNTHGLRARLYGEVSSDAPDVLELQTDWFRRWEGSSLDLLPFAPVIQTSYEVSTGPTRDLLGKRTDWVLRANQVFRAPISQRLPFLDDRPLGWLIDFKQNLGHGLDTRDGRRNWANYSLLAGLESDFPLSFYGKPARLAVVVGPEISGNNDKHFRVMGRLKIHLKF